MRKKLAGRGTLGSELREPGTPGPVQLGRDGGPTGRHRGVGAQLVGPRLQGLLGQLLQVAAGGGAEALQGQRHVLLPDEECPHHTLGSVQQVREGHLQTRTCRSRTGQARPHLFPEADFRTLRLPCSQRSDRPPAGPSPPAASGKRSTLSGPTPSPPRLGEPTGTRGPAHSPRTSPPRRC